MHGKVLLLTANENTGHISVKEATTALVQCISRGGRPAPTVSWNRNGALLEEEADTRVSVLGGLSLITFCLKSGDVDVI